MIINGREIARTVPIAAGLTRRSVHIALLQNLRKILRAIISIPKKPVEKEKNFSNRPQQGGRVT